VQVWLAVALKVMDPEGVAVGGGGMKHVVWQFAACALQFIMQLVTVEVTGVESPCAGGTTFGVACASWIISSADACCAQQIAAATAMIARARITHLLFPS
jgi:hypothetical protein